MKYGKKSQKKNVPRGTKATSMGKANTKGMGYGNGFKSSKKR